MAVTAQNDSANQAGKKPWQVNITAATRRLRGFAGVPYRLIRYATTSRCSRTAALYLLSTSDFYDKRLLPTTRNLGRSSRPTRITVLRPVRPAVRTQGRRTARGGRRLPETLLEPWEDDSQESSGATGTGDWADADR